MFQAIFTPMVSAGQPQDTHSYSLLLDFGNIFGFSTFVIALFAIVKTKHTRDHRLMALLIYGFLPLLIFSFAAIKRGPYIFLGAPAIFMLIAYYASEREKLPSIPTWIPRVLAYTSIVFIVGYSLDKMYLFRNKSSKSEWCERIKSAHPPHGAVLYNEQHYLEWMFYHDGVTAYEGKPKITSSPHAHTPPF